MSFAPFSPHSVCTVFEDHFSSHSGTDCDLNPTHLSTVCSADRNCGALTLSSFCPRLQFSSSQSQESSCILLSRIQQEAGTEAIWWKWQSLGKDRTHVYRNPTEAPTSHWPEHVRWPLARAAGTNTQCSWAPLPYPQNRALISMEGSKTWILSSQQGLCNH